LKLRNFCNDIVRIVDAFVNRLAENGLWRQVMDKSGLPLCSQRLNFATPGIPRTAEGKPNLTAPAPHTGDGKPEFSGLWRPAPNPYAPYAVDVIQDPKDESIFLPAAEALFRKHLSDFRRDNPFSHCLPGGPLNMLMPGLHRIMQSPTLLALLYEFGSSYRQIFLDGRQLPKDPNPTWLGYSAGHWDGDTLVVETAGLNDRSWLDMAGHPHSEQLHVTERFRRIDIGHIQRQITFDDPQTLTMPLTFSIALNYAPDTEMLETICENERDSAHLVGNANSGFELNSTKLARYAGTYVFREGSARVAGFMDSTQKVVVIGGTLYLNSRPLVPQSETRFDSTGTTAEFIVDSNGTVTHLILSQTEGDAKYDRKPESGLGPGK
jgi:hypothetical protein